MWQHNIGSEWALQCFQYCQISMLNKLWRIQSPLPTACTTKSSGIRHISILPQGPSKLSADHCLSWTLHIVSWDWLQECWLAWSVRHKPFQAQRCQLSRSALTVIYLCDQGRIKYAAYQDCMQQSSSHKVTQVFSYLCSKIIVELAVCYQIKLSCKVCLMQTAIVCLHWNGSSIICPFAVCCMEVILWHGRWWNLILLNEIDHEPLPIWSGVVLSLPWLCDHLSQRQHIAHQRHKR